MGYRSSRRTDGPPGWFIFLLAMGIIFGTYYFWVNLREFMRSGGLSIAQATEQSRIDATSTRVQRIVIEENRPTPRPTSTSKPPCQDFRVSTGTGIMRERASTNSGLVDQLPRGTIVCVMDSVEGADGFLWYIIDRDPITQRVEMGYMREDIVRPENPTPTPSDTSAPLPTITQIPSNTPGPTSQDSDGLPSATQTPYPTVTPLPPTVTPTPRRVSA